MAAVFVLGGYILLTNREAAAVAQREARRPRNWIVGVPVTVFALTVGVPFIYTQVLSGTPAKPLTFADLTGVPAGASQTTTAVADQTTTTVAGVTTTLPASFARANTATVAAPQFPLGGAWRIGHGTQAGYSVDDEAMGQTSRVVGRTSLVSGTMRIDGATVTAVHAVVDMKSVTCHCIHDAKYQSMLETSKYPTSSFDLTRPITFNLPAPNVVISVPVTGNFTIHGVTRSQTFTLKATRIGDRLAVNGSVPVKLADYNVSSPDAGSMGGLHNPQIDLLIAFDRA